MAAVSSVLPSPFAPAAFTETKEDEGTLSYCGLERSKTAPLEFMSDLGLFGAVRAPWMVWLEAEGAAPGIQVALAAPSVPVV